MHLISFRTPDGERLGVATATAFLAAEDLVPAGPSTMAALLAAGADALAALRAAADPGRIDHDGRPLAEAHLLAPVGRPGKVIAIGRNYRDHAAEGAADLPPAPLIFSKWPSCVIGPEDEIRWDPTYATKVDYEAELGVVIGRAARRVSEAEALDYVLGYTCLDDVTARDFQFGDGQWARGKSLDTFCPIGPVIVTTDEIPDPQSLAISCSVNGRVLQSSSTRDMIFGVATIVSYCSQAFSLEPGDVIATGTPAGVGIFRDPPVLLGDGDEVVVEIEGIGRLANTCRFDRPEAAAG